MIRAALERNLTPLLSIVIPVFNSAGYLGRCLDSILALRSERIEIILVDDGSDDGSYELCREYAGRSKNIRLIRHERNLGPGLARNTGLDLVGGKYVFFVDSDDVVQAAELSSLLGLLEEARADIIFWRAVFASPQAARERGVGGAEGAFSPESFIAAQDWQSFNQLCFMAFRADFVRERRLRFSASYYIEDLTFIAQALFWAGNVYSFPAAVYVHTVGRPGALTDSMRAAGNELVRRRLYAAGLHDCEIMAGLSAFANTPLKEYLVQARFEENMRYICGNSPADWLGAKMRRLAEIGIPAERSSDIAIFQALGYDAAAAQWLRNFRHRLADKNAQGRKRVFFAPASAESANIAARLRSSGFSIAGFLDNTPSKANWNVAHCLQAGFSVEQTGNLNPEDDILVVVCHRCSLMPLLAGQFAALGFEVGRNLLFSAQTRTALPVW